MAIISSHLLTFRHYYHTPHPSRYPTISLLPAFFVRAGCYIAYFLLTPVHYNLLSINFSLIVFTLLFSIHAVVDCYLFQRGYINSVYLLCTCTASAILLGLWVLLWYVILAIGHSGFPAVIAMVGGIVAGIANATLVVQTLRQLRIDHYGGPGAGGIRLG